MVGAVETEKMRSKNPVVGLGEDVLTAQLLRSVSIFRWAAFTWATLGVLLSRDQLTRPVLAILLLLVAGAFSVAMSFLVATRPDVLSDARVLGIEVCLGMILLFGDGLVYESTRSQSLPWAWPAAGIIAVGICRGQRAGLLTAIVVGSASLATELLLLDRSQFVAAFSKIGLWLLVGTIAGALAQRLRAAEREISLARTREEVARELHDGVLQTLAVIQRRSGDPELSRLAKKQENSLRRYLADSRIIGLSATSAPAGQLDVAKQSDSEQPSSLLPPAQSAPPTTVLRLETALRDTAAQAEDQHNLVCQIIVTQDCPDSPALPQAVIRAIAGATGEAITNAAKHGQASKVTIFAEPSERATDTYGLFVSIKDDGVGFKIDEMIEGIGLSRSIRGRIEEHNGRIEIRSRPGRGCEVQLWL